MSLPLKKANSLSYDASSNHELEPQKQESSIETPYGRLLIGSHIAMLKHSELADASQKDSSDSSRVIHTWPMEGWGFLSLDESHSFAVFAHQEDWRFALLDLFSGKLIKDDDTLFPRFWIEEAETATLSKDIFHCRQTGLSLLLLDE